MNKHKSVAVSIILTILFGAFGLFYAGSFMIVAGSFVAAAILTVVLPGIGWVLAWGMIVGIGIHLVRIHNEKRAVSQIEQPKSDEWNT